MTTCTTTDNDQNEELWLPDALWHHILSFSGPTDLCAMALVNYTFRSWANQDGFWKVHCQKRWEGKQGVSRFRYHRTWKQGYAWTEYDKHRKLIRREEICLYAWKLTYNGAESRMGLRRFREDGTYHSPYAGVCEWGLYQNKLCFMGIALPVERDKETWGWVIGKGHNTEYRSIEA
jgi:hypothetical protein